MRYMIGAFLMLGFANVYAMRVNLSMGLAVMVADLTVMRGGKEVQVIFDSDCGMREKKREQNSELYSLLQYSSIANVCTNIVLILRPYDS